MAPTGAYPPQGPPPYRQMWQPPPVIVLAPAAPSFDLNRFGTMRFVGAVGAGLALLGAFSTWLSIPGEIISITGVGFASLGGLSSLLNPLILYTGVLAALASGLGLLALLLKGARENLLAGGAMGFLTLILGMLFIVGFLLTPVGSQALGALGYGFFMTVVGGIVMIVGSGAQLRRTPFGGSAPGLGVGSYGPPGYAYGLPGVVPAAPFALPYGYAAPGHGGYAPPPIPAAGGCPRCGAPVAAMAPRCANCGLELTWG